MRACRLRTLESVLALVLAGSQAIAPAGAQLGPSSRTDISASLRVAASHRTIRLIATITVGQSPIGVCVDSTTRRVYVSNWTSDTVSVIDADTLQVLDEVPVGDQPEALLLNGSNELYVVAVLDEAVVVLDALTLTFVREYSVGSAPSTVAIDLNTKVAYVPNRGDQSLSVLYPDGGEVKIPVAGTPLGVAVNPTTARAYVTSIDADTVSVINTNTDQILRVLAARSFPSFGIALDLAQDVAYVPNLQSDTVTVIDGGTQEVTSTIPVGSGPERSAFDPVQRRLYVGNTNSDSVSVVDAKTGEVIASIAVGRHPLAVLVDSLRQLVYVANLFGDSVTVIDARENAVLTTISVGAQPAEMALDNTSGHVYVTNLRGNTVSVLGPLPATPGPVETHKAAYPGWRPLPSRTGLGNRLFAGFDPK